MVAAATAAMASGFAAGARGTLDPTFDRDGRVVTDLGSSEGAIAVAALPDGKILAAAPRALLRYDSSGAPDATFDEDGIRGFSGLVAADMAIAPDGKIVLVGTADFDLAVARFNDDGTPDATFSEDGLATLATFDDPPDGAWGTAVAVQPDGKIVVVGGTQANHPLGDGIVARFTADGTPDPSFSGGWRGAFPFDFPDSANSVSLQPDGKIVVAGSAYFIAEGADRGELNFAVARFRSDGRRDTSFSGDGAVRTRFGLRRTRFGLKRSDVAWDVTVQPDGKIVAGGSTSGNFALARYTARGRLDATFSADGRQRTDFGGGPDAARGIALQANGRIILAGSASGRFAVARYTRAGNLDPSFSGNGKHRTRFGSNDRDYGSDVALQSDGRSVVGGRVTPGTRAFDVGLARYLP